MGEDENGGKASFKERTPRNRLLRTTAFLHTVTHNDGFPGLSCS